MLMLNQHTVTSPNPHGHTPSSCYHDDDGTHRRAMETPRSGHSERDPTREGATSSDFWYFVVTFLINARQRGNKK